MRAGASPLLERARDCGAKSDGKSGDEDKNEFAKELDDRMNEVSRSEKVRDGDKSLEQGNHWL